MAFGGARPSRRSSAAPRGIRSVQSDVVVRKRLGNLTSPQPDTRPAVPDEPCRLLVHQEVLESAVPRLTVFDRSRIELAVPVSREGSAMIATRAAVISIAFAVLALLPTGCNSGPSNNDRRAIHAWLTCDDCASGQRGAVAVLGDNAVPELADALEGPTSDQRAIMTAKFESSFSRIASRVSPMQKGAYTTFRNDNYIANYQKRAAISLGDIGTDAARKALDGALADSATRKYRSDVMRVIKFARSRVDGTTYPGKIVPFRLGFADPVKVVADSGHQFGQQATVT